MGAFSKPFHLVYVPVRLQRPNKRVDSSTGNFTVPFLMDLFVRYNNFQVYLQHEQEFFPSLIPLLGNLLARQNLFAHFRVFLFNAFHSPYLLFHLCSIYVFVTACILESMTTTSSISINAVLEFNPVYFPQPATQILQEVHRQNPYDINADSFPRDTENKSPEMRPLSHCLLSPRDSSQCCPETIKQLCKYYTVRLHLGRCDTTHGGPRP